ncbi:hypothetical protein FB451DRAFT_1411273 [Mycena latifolia]|nr:hypothetical protein FB451DRAFT_1411273 [Mycena latifolia]
MSRLHDILLRHALLRDISLWHLEVNRCQYSPANLADATACSRDLANFKKLGVTRLDSPLNHESCMSVLRGTGISIILALALGEMATVIFRIGLRDQYIKTINVFNKYNNVLE